jgi:hypothetical protein
LKRRYSRSLSRRSSCTCACTHLCLFWPYFVFFVSL